MPRKTKQPPRAETYRHPDATSPMRPDVGTQAQFRKRKPPATYRYDSSLSPALEWDGRNPAREEGEALLRAILEAETIDDAKAAARKLAAMSRPFLDWAGKAERLSFDVPTLPLFVHERLSTKAILETLKGHRRDQTEQLGLFGDPQHSITDQILRAYEHRDRWVNRMILGDSLVVMNSLLHYEGLGGQVQMIYIDPPYGVKFGSNFQPFVRKRDVSHGDDEDMTREPEMVKAYRDTWELGLHSYLTYMRDRLLLARELLAPSGSVFVQISDENLHHVRELLDEIFGPENACTVILMRKSGWAASTLLPQVHDFVLWYARDRSQQRYRQLFLQKTVADAGEVSGAMVESPDGSTMRALIAAEREDPRSIPKGWKLFFHDNLTSEGHSTGSSGPFTFAGREFWPGVGKRTDRHWKTTPHGLDRLAAAGRLLPIGDTLRQKRYFNDFPFATLSDHWDDTAVSGFAEQKLYVVQTNVKAMQRCLLMTTDPGDLVLDPTCGSGTTAYVAEQWGRRWITIDTSRVPLALARQRLLTATYPWYQLKDEQRGPAGGFVYERKKNRKGEEVGGIVPHVTLKSIANDEPPAEEVLVDRPNETSGITRVSGPFAFEATIPTPIDDGEAHLDEGGRPSDEHGSFVERMIEVLRRSPVLRLEGNRTAAFTNVRPPTKSASLSAEATDADGKPVAFVFGPENGAVSERLVYEAGYEARPKGYAHLYVIGFAIQPNARELVVKSDEVFGVPATYVQATPDLMMADLLKNTRASQIFSVCGMPEIAVRPVDGGKLEVELLGLDVFDPVTMEVEQRRGDDVPAWLLDTDYNGLSFHVCQAFFPRTSAWENLRRALRTEYAESVWDHLAGTTSAPFEAGEQRRIAVKVIDDRGNELLVVKGLGGR